MILIDLNEQADRDFGRARRRSWLRRLVSRLRGEPASRRIPPSFDEARRSLRARNRTPRGMRAVDPQKIVGSVGRCRDFDRSFMPLRTSVGERWKRVDLAFHRNVDLPPVSLYKLGDAYFVEDGNHRVSVARFHGAEWIDAYVTEFRPARRRPPRGTRSRAGIEGRVIKRGAWPGLLPSGINRASDAANTIWKLVDRETGDENHRISWAFTEGERVKIRLVNEMDSDHPMHHPFRVHGTGRCRETRSL